ncbi:MAG TPA: BglII/BstYI family type II restriction endonuclease [Pirellulales bacterium]|nr:BglII/BstYI family type II restriction endonuclease [Pirellulales bacterium]
MKANVYSHRFGDKVVPSSLLEEIVGAVADCAIAPQQGSSKSIKSAILDALVSHGWPGKVGLDIMSRISISSLKDKVGLCFQTGNMGRMYADLIKLQTLYLRGTIDAGVFIVPETRCAKLLGENIADCGRLLRELPIFDRAITVPLAVIGIE